MEEPAATMPARLRTERLEIVPGTPALGRAEMGDRARFAQLLGAEVPTSWPPPENDEKTMTFFTEYVETHPDGVGWAAWYILLCGGDGRKTAIGTCGFTAKPDQTGTVETGYSILPEHQRRGYAPEAVAALVEWAFSHPVVERVIAHTFPDLRASIRVLEKCGFALVGAGDRGRDRPFRAPPVGIPAKSRSRRPGLQPSCSLRIPNPESRIPSPEPRAPSRIPNPESRVPSPGNPIPRQSGG